MDKIIKDYHKIIEAFSPLTKQAEEMRKSTAPITKMVGEFQKQLKAINTDEIQKNLTKGLQDLIRTSELKQIGLYSKSIGSKWIFRARQTRLLQNHRAYRE